MIGNDYETPIMYQDLANSTMGPMAMPPVMANPYANTNLLGGASMQRQLDDDKIEIAQAKDKQDKSTFKKAIGILGVCLALGAIPIVRKNIKKAGGIGKYLKNKWNGFVDFLKGNKVKKAKIKKSKSTDEPEKTKKSLFQRFKNLFKRNKKEPVPPEPIIIIE